MAGERLARQELRLHDITLNVGINLWLGGAYRYFKPVHTQAPLGPNEWWMQIPLRSGTFADFVVDYTRSGRLFAAAIRARLTALGSPYVVREQFVGTDPVLCYYEVIIEAPAYDPAYDFPVQPTFPDSPAGQTGGYNPQLRLPTIRPVLVAVVVTPATIFGTADGSIALTASNGSTGNYTYDWLDGPASTAARTGLLAGTYTCIVSDASGASNTVVVVVTSDPRLDVLINRVADTVTLVPSGACRPTPSSGTTAVPLPSAGAWPWAPTPAP